MRNFPVAAAMHPGRQSLVVSCRHTRFRSKELVPQHGFLVYADSAGIIATAPECDRKVVMIEPVRLVIWDLDETFWRGTLTEGGITFLPEHRDIVIELARRGIVSSICSKNDFEVVRKLLIEHEIWDYFVLPSISWHPKGPRVQSLIETIGLRPPTVLFVDDNSTNLEEARQFVPDIQTQSHEFVGSMLGSELFRGKDDRAFSRLKQYKVLEQRKNDQAAAGPNVNQFLRDSDIRVRLEFDVEPHIDRVIELINRTNQLNFTKTRLPETSPEARSEVLRILSLNRTQVALVHVRDRYGDHGYCGVYVHNSEERRLEHFAFSCRILGMGVERWLYQKLGCPKIVVCGEVLADIYDPNRIDWISQEFYGAIARKPLNSGQDHSSASGTRSLGKIIGRGSCDLGAVIHYFTATTSNALGEYHIFRKGGTFRIDHSIFLRHAINGVSPDAMIVAERIGYLKTDFETRLFDNDAGTAFVILSFGADAFQALYRHRATGILLPFTVNVPGRMNSDLRPIANSEIPNAQSKWVTTALNVLRAEFDYAGTIQENDFKANLDLALTRIPRCVRVFVLNFLDTVFTNQDNSKRAPSPRIYQINQWIDSICMTHGHAQVINMSKMVSGSMEVRDFMHFDRKVYFRIYKAICQQMRIPEDHGSLGELVTN